MPLYFISPPYTSVDTKKSLDKRTETNRQDDPLADTHFDCPKAVGAKCFEAFEAIESEQHPLKAARLWDEALAMAEQCGMHPWSIEVIGMKWSYFFMLEKAGLTARAIDMAEQLRDDGRKYLEANSASEEMRPNSKLSLAAQSMVQSMIGLADFHLSEPMPDQQAADDARLWTINTVLHYFEDRLKEGDTILSLKSDDLGELMLGRETVLADGSY